MSMLDCMKLIMEQMVRQMKVNNSQRIEKIDEFIQNKQDDCSDAGSEFDSTTMYGYSFCMASKQAFRLLSNNILRVAAINSVGDFVLFLGKVLVVVATVLCGIELLKDKEGLQHMWVPITLAGLFGYFVAHCFITVYEMTIDTIFLCFCEDCERNDGISKPYYMSRGLMEFVENSKKALNIHDSQQQTNRLQAWQQ